MTAADMRAPLDVGFELSNLCNLHCVHCIRGSVQSHIDRLDAGLFRRILDQAMALFDPVGVVFTGGEPLASELFPAAVAEVAGRGLAYRFVTNGWLLPRHLPLLVRHPPRFVRVSLSGATETTHDAARGRGSFRRALLAAAALLSRGLRTELSMVVTRDSRGELRTAVELANALGIAELHFILPQPTPESVAADLDLAPAAWREVEREVHRLAAASRVPVGLDYGSYLPMPRPRCNTMALRQLYVDAHGRVPFCCQLSRYGTGPEPILGDLREEPLAAVAARARDAYRAFGAETARRKHAGRWDEVDDFPCVSCARRHGRTGFLATAPTHPWAKLAELPA
jgi:MoaA/NifB/PqqE/SkfB family radical SAM enzyme